jgi:hypothetical protein
MRGRTRFWYLAFGDGRAGYLLDLIARPDAAVARLALFQRGQPPRVLRRQSAAAALEGDARGATLMPWRLGDSSCEGELEGVSLSARLEAAGPEVPLVPRWIAAGFAGVPALWSQPVTVIEARAGGDVFRNLPGVRARYAIRDLARARWLLISAHGFDGRADVRCEIAVGRLPGRWAASGYLCTGGETIALNQPLHNLVRFRVHADGALAGGARRFAVSYASPRLDLHVEASAPADLFAELEREGSTSIYTTLFGDCRLDVKASSHESLTATGTCLLEVKGER